VTAHYTCSDRVSGIDSCPADQIFSTDGTNQLAVGVAFDVAGNQATASSSINIDMTPPLITLSPPTTGQTGTTVYTPSVTVSGTASDGGSGLAATTCNGSPASVSGGAFSCIAALAPGSNSVDATATDAAGNTASTSLSFTYIRVPIITIASPANLSYTS